MRFTVSTEERWNDLGGRFCHQTTVNSDLGGRFCHQTDNSDDKIEQKFIMGAPRRAPVAETRMVFLAIVAMLASNLHSGKKEDLGSVLQILGVFMRLTIWKLSLENQLHWSPLVRSTDVRSFRM